VGLRIAELAKQARRRGQIWIKARTVLEMGGKGNGIRGG